VIAKPKWSIVMATTKSGAKVRQTYISGFLVCTMVLFIIAGFVGLVRLAWYTTSLGVAKFGVYEARQENEGLLLKIQFLKRFILKEKEKVEKLVKFEDRVRLQYGMNSISSDVRMAGIGGRPTNQDLLMVTLLDPVLLGAEKVKENLNDLLRQAILQDSTLHQMTQQVSSIHKKWSQRPSIWPTTGRITSPFGYRMHPILGQSIFHEGIDIANEIGTPVYATADGVVRFTGVKEDYGNVVILTHPDVDCETYYAHLSKYVVKIGQKIKRGDLIAHIGSTGRSTGPHLHYEVRVGNRHMNPLSFILPENMIVD